MSKSTPRLGKGLSALISPPRRMMGADDALGSAEQEGIRRLPISSIRRNPQQPRQAFDAAAIESLAESIRGQGVLQPILVRPLGGGKYELVAGERRWRAARQAGLKDIPVIVRNVTEAESLEIALIENLQREDLNPLERATAYRQYLDTFGMTADELAKRLGESRPNISNYLRLLQLDDQIRGLIESGELGMGQARAIAGIEDKQRQLAIARLAARRNLAVRQVEALAKEPGRTKPAEAEAKVLPRHLAEVEDALGRALGVPLKLMPGKKKNSGRIVIRYRNLEEFDLIAEKFGGNSSLE